MCGIILSNTSLSFKASFTNLKSKYFKYLNPPWISFVDADEVPLARSFISAKQTFSPLPEASLATPHPFIPPPIIKIS